MKMIFQSYICFGMLSLNFPDAKFTFFFVSQSYIIFIQEEGYIKWNSFAFLKEKC